MKRAAHTFCSFVACLALAGQLLLSGLAAAGAVTGYGLDGHVEVNWSKFASAAAGLGVELGTPDHSSRLDAVISGVTKSSRQNAFPASGGDLIPVAVEPGINPSTIGLLTGAITPTAPPPDGGASSVFAETIRLLI